MVAWIGGTEVKVGRWFAACEATVRSNDCVASPPRPSSTPTDTRGAPTWAEVGVQLTTPVARSMVVDGDGDGAQEDAGAGAHEEQVERVGLAVAGDPGIEGGGV